MELQSKLKRGHFNSTILVKSLKTIFSRGMVLRKWNIILLQTVVEFVFNSVKCIESTQ